MQKELSDNMLKNETQLLYNTIKLPYNELPFYEIFCLTNYFREFWPSLLEICNFI